MLVQRLFAAVLLLACAGLAPLTYNLRQGDERNPHGYF